MLKIFEISFKCTLENFNFSQCTQNNFFEWLKWSSKFSKNFEKICVIKWENAADVKNTQKGQILKIGNLLW